MKLSSTGGLGNFSNFTGDSNMQAILRTSIIESGFPCSSDSEESACNAGDLGLVPGLGRSPGEGKGYPLQYSGLENSMDSPWFQKESDTTDRLSLSLSLS